MSDSRVSSRKDELRIELFGRTFSVSRFVFLLLLGILVGALTGLVSVVFRLAAMAGHAHLFPFHYDENHMVLFTPDASLRVIMPMVGGLISGLLLFKIGKFTGSHSIPAILRAVASGRTHLKWRVAFPPSLALLTLTSGGSAGPEGPIAELGSVMGSQIGQVAKAPPRMMKTLIGSGVAAGISAVFNAPIGGVFFAIEVILRNYEVASFTPIVVAAVTSSVIARAALGSQGMALSIPAMSVHLDQLHFYLALGLLCGATSILFIYTLEWCRRRFQLLHLPLWSKPAIGGLVVGLIGLFMPLVMGEGYEWIQSVVDGEAPLTRHLGLLAGLVMLKIFATGVTLGSGNPGGSFAPAVFVGVMLGAAFGALLQNWGWIADVTPFAVVGMAAMIAGALGAPLTGIMIALGFSGSSSIEVLLALMSAVAICMFVMQFWSSVSVYTLEFVRLGIDLDRARGADPLSLVAVKSVMQTTGYEELPADMEVYEALERLKDSSARWFVVRRGDGEFVGIVSLHEMRLAIAEEELAHLLVLEDITDSFQPRLTPEMSIKEALSSFNSADVEVLPICDRGGDRMRLVGVLSRQDALNAYREFADSVT